MIELKTAIYEQDEDTQENEREGALPLIMTASDSGLTIEARDGRGSGFAVATVLVELYRGQLRVLVWDGSTNNDSGDPSHKITILEDAHARVDSDGVLDDEEDDEDLDDDREVDL
jgi:hypothetical protein